MGKPRSARIGGTAEPAPGAAEVADYLRRHPGFLEDNPDLLARLAPPAHHTGKGVVDMQKFMVERLQREVERQNRNQSELLSASRRNQSRQSRVHGVALEIIAAASFEKLVETVTDDLALRLDVDVAELCVEASGGPRDGARPAGIRILEPGAVDAIFGDGRTVLLRAGTTPLAPVFGGAAPLVASEALLRLDIGDAAPAGLLALGSRRPGHFEAGQATELLGFLASVLAITIRAWLGPPA